MSRCERLPLDVRAMLGPYFPDLDLSRIVLRHGIPFHAGTFAAITPVAYTSGRRIYFDPASCDPFCVSGIPFLAHELVHVRQFQETRWFRLKYFGEYVRLWSSGFEKAEAYMRISYEIEASAMEQRVRRELDGEPVRRDTDSSKR